MSISLLRLNITKLHSQSNRVKILNGSEKFCSCLRVLLSNPLHKRVLFPRRAIVVGRNEFRLLDCVEQAIGVKVSLESETVKVAVDATLECEHVQQGCHVVGI